MRHYRLTNQERAATGFTDAYAIDHNDLTEADGSQVLTLETLPNGTTTLYSDACMVCTEAFDEGATVSAVVAKVGHLEINNDNTANDDYFIVDGSLFTVDTFYGPAATTTGAGIYITANTPLTATFTVTGATNAELTKGSCVIYFKIIRSTDVVGAQG